MTSRRLYPFILAEFDATGLTANYQPINAGFTDPGMVMHIVNTSDVSVMISYDGVTDHDVILEDNEVVYNMQLNNQPSDLIAEEHTGTVVYVKQILGAGKGGDIYLTGYHSQ